MLTQARGTHYTISFFTFKIALYLTFYFRTWSAAPGADHLEIQDWGHQTVNSCYMDKWTVGLHQWGVETKVWFYQQSWYKVIWPTQRDSSAEVLSVSPSSEWIQKAIKCSKHDDSTWISFQ